MKLAETDPEAKRVMLENGHLPQHSLPDLEADEFWIWRCFTRLTHDRPQHPGGMGPPIPGRISWYMLRQWAEAERLTEEQFEFLDYCIGEMDLEYMEHEAEKRNKG